MLTSALDAEKIGSKQEERTTNVHRLDSLNLLIFTTLLVVVVLTIWIFKRRNFRYIHETCLALIYGRMIVETNFPRHNLRSLSLGFIIGAILRHTNTSNSTPTILKMNDTLFPKNSIPNWVSFE